MVREAVTEAVTDSVMFYLGANSQRETWRCQGCQRLLYNKSPDGYACEGAPLPLYVNKQFTMVCSVCYEMHTAIDKADPLYWNSPVKEFRPVRPDPNHEHC